MLGATRQRSAPHESARNAINAKHPRRPGWAARPAKGVVACDEAVNRMRMTRVLPPPKLTVHRRAMRLLKTTSSTGSMSNSDVTDLASGNELDVREAGQGVASGFRHEHS